MKQTTQAIQGREVCFFSCEEPKVLLVQPVGQEEKQALEQQFLLLQEAAGDTPIQWIALPIERWNDELTPWTAPPVFGKTPFGEEGPVTLRFLLEEVLPLVDPHHERPTYLAGYSLGGLFALWSGTQTDRFDGIAGVSPSAWYPEFFSYVQQHPLQTKKVYLSLGDEEENTDHPVLHKVGDCVRAFYEHFQGIFPQGCTTLEWNKGDHFTDVPLRMKKAYSWLLK